jgi:microcystin degradation protein MlrC
MPDVGSGGVSVVVTSRRKPFLRVGDLLTVGLGPTQSHVTAIKMGNLFPELHVAARRVLLALTPGTVDLDMAGLAHRRVPRPVLPLDLAMAWEPELRIFGGP